MKSIFDYLEYREYLKDYFDYHKKTHSYFSYRYVSKKTGLDASFYVKVLQKQMHISYKAVGRLIDFLKLNKKESEYFSLLVHFNKSKQKEQIKHFFEKLISLRSPITKTLDVQKYEFFNKWYYIALRELLNYYPFKDNDFKGLATQLNPPVTVHDVKRGVKLLEKLHLIQKVPDGGFELSDGFLSAGDVGRSIAVLNFQKEMMKLGLDALDRVPKQFRDISTATVNTSWECFENIKERLTDVRKEIMEMVQNDENPEAVFQINFQIFPLTTPPEKNGNNL
ncbi:MAG: TIGR02147 family protein [Fibrobacteria bacterium]|nr:TIGR02147 family protein [Fibrobacteria bacterium]